MKLIREKKVTFLHILMSQSQYTYKFQERLQSKHLMQNFETDVTTNENIAAVH